MKIQLDKEYGIKRLDANNLVVYKLVERTKKEDKSKYMDEEVLGFYSTLQVALKGYVKHSTRNCDCQSVAELLEKLEEINLAIKNIK